MRQKLQTATCVIPSWSFQNRVVTASGLCNGPANFELHEQCQYGPFTSRSASKPSFYDAEHGRPVDLHRCNPRSQHGAPASGLNLASRRCRRVSGFDDDETERDHTESIPALNRDAGDDELINGILEVGRFKAPAIALGVRGPEASQRLRDLWHRGLVEQDRGGWRASSLARCRCQEASDGSSGISRSSDSWPAGERSCSGRTKASTLVLSGEQDNGWLLVMIGFALSGLSLLVTALMFYASGRVSAPLLPSGEVRSPSACTLDAWPGCATTGR